MSRLVPRFVYVVLILACQWVSGCVVFVSATHGSPLSFEKVAKIKKGETTLPELLTIMGAPTEFHRHADGRILFYRYKERNLFLLDISPSRVLSFVDVSQVASEVGSNLSLVIERTHEGEDRLVVMIDNRDIVKAVGFLKGTRDLPLY